MENPTIEELQNSENYVLVHELEHNNIREFIMKQIASGSKLIKGFMYYQLLMIITGIFFTTRPLVLAVKGDFTPLFYLMLAVVFTFSFLILAHELLHALAFKLTGAPKVSIGAYLKKFIFYAEADRHVINRKQFTFVALAPLISVKILTGIAILLTASTPVVFFWIFIMCVHSLFCAGDIGMIDFINNSSGNHLYTFDIKEEKKSYFYSEK